MKKLLSIGLALMLTCSFVACGDSEKSTSDNHDVLVEFFDENSVDFVKELESGLESTGFTCDTELEVVGDGIVIDININELEDVEDSIKDAMQQSYDNMDETFETALEQLQEEIPELKYMTINVCDKNGEALATIETGDN